MLQAIRSGLTLGLAAMSLILAWLVLPIEGPREPADLTCMAVEPRVVDGVWDAVGPGIRHGQVLVRDLERKEKHHLEAHRLNAEIQGDDK
jgi:hypothetical protein